MAKKRASLLNAFNTALPKRVEPPRAAPVEQPRLHFDARADEVMPVRAPPPAPPPLRRPGTHSEPPAPRPPFARGRMLLLSIVGATVLLIVVIVLKFGSKSGEAEVGVAYASAPGATPVVAPTSEPPATKIQKSGLDPTVGETDDDKAFRDVRNKFTVRLAQYENDANGLKVAKETYKYLRSDGVPAIQPIRSGDGRFIYLCADAKPKKEDLAGLCAYIKRLRGPDKRSTPFDDAYLDNIERLIQR